jgi:hypothetical protein
VEFPARGKGQEAAWSNVAWSNEGITGHASTFDGVRPEELSTPMTAMMTESARPRKKFFTRVFPSAVTRIVSPGDLDWRILSCKMLVTFDQIREKLKRADPRRAQYQYR